MKDYTGQRFGRWTVIGYSGKRENETPVWDCRCDCGGERGVRSTRLAAGKSQGCGCDRYRNNTTHGQTDSLTYRVWRSMILRCESKGNASYAVYGGRGIKVCERWRHDFAAFLSDMGERPTAQHSIDRLDNDRDYEPGNCQWSTVVKQNRHRRSTKLTEDKAAEIRSRLAAGATQKELAKEFGVTPSLVSMVASGRIWT